MYLENNFDLSSHQNFEQLVGRELELILHRYDPVCPKCGSHIAAKYGKARYSLIRTI
ncbi:MAG: hypothetical protein LBR15_02155 [Methanobrevibacter sp.]|nr:hypothetical protein [Candidatus Methanovirga australis]